MTAMLPQNRRRMPSAPRKGSSPRQSRRHERSAQTRTCIGCRGLDQQENLLRLVATSDGNVAFDLAGGTFGRGAWVHPRTECLVKSAKGLSHAFRANFAVTARELLESLVATAWRRTEALLRAAKRAGHLQVGADAGGNAWVSGKVTQVVLAEDARATFELSWVLAAQAAGKALVGPSKTTLGNWCGQDVVAVVALTDAGLAKAIARSMAVAQLHNPTEGCRESERGTEVG